ncbi:hypothetical protein [Crocosphaera sp. XPORK-15E]|uniref:hypothetical protein n=1 Tax=Crocosphaera sp. XPORK-15E TaxID=3110247 RepID=UPI002B210A1B|nr:hypothetical protein [Crocosphaera sp. XPORK-15E]MEA5534296.1 hypothetical protein [Crocosphaera sp. XPORK-15E]
MSKLLVNLRKVILLIVLSVIILAVVIQPAMSHRPHDVVNQIELSPTYDQDNTLWIIVRSNLFKSVDGGESWQRITNGIDSRTDLSGLDMFAQSKDIRFYRT